MVASASWIVIRSSTASRRRISCTGSPGFNSSRKRSAACVKGFVSTSRASTSQSPSSRRKPLHSTDRVCISRRRAPLATFCSGIFWSLSEFDDHFAKRRARLHGLESFAKILERHDLADDGAQLAGGEPVEQLRDQPRVGFGLA